MALFESFPGEKLAIRIWDTLEKSGIGLLRPAQMRREGIAKAEVEHRLRLALAQAEKDASDIAEGRVAYDPSSGRLLPIQTRTPLLPTLEPPAESAAGSSGERVPRLGSALEFGGGISRGIAIRETRRAINLEHIIQQAGAEAIGVNDDVVSDAPLNPDWLARWRDSAQDVSDEDVQRLWARALTGEIQSPGRYSLRTLDFLRSVSKPEAELIAKVGPLSFVAFIYRERSLLEQRGLPFGTLSWLQNLGILAGVESIGIDWNIHPHADGAPSAVAYVCCELGVRVSNVSAHIQIPIYSITALGGEILTLGKFQADRDYVAAFAKFVASRGAKCTIGQANLRGDGTVMILPPLETFDPPPPPG